MAVNPPFPHFTPPTDIPQRESPAAAFLKPVAGAIANIPSTIMTYQDIKMRHMLNEAQIRQLQANAGTGVLPGQEPTNVSVPATQEQAVPGGVSVAETPLPAPQPSPADIVTAFGSHAKDYADVLKAEKEKKTIFLNHDSKTGQLTTMDGLPFDMKTADPNADYKLATVGSGGGAGGQAFKSEAELRKEFEAQSAEFMKSSNAASHALTLAKRGDAIGDTALAFALTKGALGGQGRVTQTEIQQFGPQMGGLPDRIQQALLGLSAGKKYDPAIRSQIVDMVKQQFEADSAQQKEQADYFKKLAVDNGFNPTHIVRDLTPPELRPGAVPGVPQPGDVKGGFKFKGGDPADKKNWMKQ